MSENVNEIWEAIKVQSQTIETLTEGLRILTSTVRGLTQRINKLELEDDKKSEVSDA